MGRAGQAARDRGAERTGSAVRGSQIARRGRTGRAAPAGPGSRAVRPGAVPGRQPAGTGPPAPVPTAPGAPGQLGTGRRRQDRSRAPGSALGPGSRPVPDQAGRHRKAPAGMRGPGRLEAMSRVPAMPSLGTRHVAGQPAVRAQGRQGTHQAAPRARPGTARWLGGNFPAGTPWASPRAPTRVRRIRRLARRPPAGRNPGRRNRARRNWDPPGRWRSPACHAGPVRSPAARRTESLLAQELPPRNLVSW